MSQEENKLLRPHFSEEVLTNGNLAVGDEPCAVNEQEVLERKSFRLALALATTLSQLGQLRQILVHLQQQRGVPEAFFPWACRQIDERVMSMVLEYAHDAEVMVQLLSFKGGTFESLMHDVEDIYQHEQISQRVYAKAKLLLRTNEPPWQA